MTAYGSVLTAGYRGDGLRAWKENSSTRTYFVSFAYDAAGNRTAMTDGLGSVSYVYNQLSQLTSETRTFNGIGSFALNYNSYNLAGELTSFTNPWNVQVSYGYDLAGRLNAVNGYGYADVSTS